MTLWAINRSPLMFGGDLPSNDEFTLRLLTNDAVLELNQSSCANRELFRQEDRVVWTAKSATSNNQYLALFNIGESSDCWIEVDFALLGEETSYHVLDLWDGTHLGEVKGKLRQHIAPHAAKLFQLQRL
jgi:hypothetical protein